VEEGPVPFSSLVTHHSSLVAVAGEGPIINEVRHALRLLGRAPGVTVVAVVTLAVGIGLNTATFAILDAVVLRPLPYREPDRLVALWEVMEEDGGKAWRVCPEAFDAWRQEKGPFADMAAFGSAGFVLTGVGEPQQLRGARVSTNYFGLLGVAPVLGRAFRPEEALPGSAPVVILGREIWVSRFGGDPGILGRAVTLDGVPRTVVGVMPAGLFPAWPLTTAQIEFEADKHQFWIPVRFREGPGRHSHVLGVLARLSPGISLDAARRDVSALATRHRREGAEEAGHDVRIRRLADQVHGDVAPGLYVLAAAVGLLLLIACVNVAGLQLARGTARRREIAIRAALGASRSRLVAQLLIEGIVLGAAGGLLGALLAGWSLPAFLRLAPAGIPRLAEVGLHPRVIALAACASLVAGAFSGLLPALRLTGRHAADLGEAGRSATGSRSARRSLRVLVVAEIGLAAILVVGAALLTRSFGRIRSVDLGFRGDHALIVDLSLPSARYETWPAAARFFDSLLERIRGVPGVQSAAIAYNHPLESHWIGGLRPEGAAAGREESSPAWFRAVGEGYFASIGAPILAGRDFTAQDDTRQPGVAIVNESLARRYFPGASPIGKSFEARDAVMWWGEGLPTRFEIVGVVPDVRFLGPTHAAEPAYYLSARQFPLPDMKLVVRTTGDPLRLLPVVRSAVRALDPAQPIGEVRTLSGIASDAVAEPRLNMRLMIGFGGVGLALAAVGIYGLLAFVVTMRRREIAIRIALGARPRDVSSLILGETARLTAAGLAAGLAGAFALGPLLRPILFGVNATDAAALAAAPLMLAVVALAATLWPALRAARVNPVVALKENE
jgi:putative ABC transport system permease protein